jgi:hypothetical protein
MLPVYGICDGNPIILSRSIVLALASYASARASPPEFALSR